jgi:hypothetical protein
MLVGLWVTNLAALSIRPPQRFFQRLSCGSLGVPLGHCLVTLAFKVAGMLNGMRQSGISETLFQSDPVGAPMVADVCFCLACADSISGLQ